MARIANVPKITFEDLTKKYGPNVTSFRLVPYARRHVERLNKSDEARNAKVYSLRDCTGRHVDYVVAWEDS